MDRVHAAALVLLLMLGTGCPHAFGKGGTIDRAALKDIVENLRQDSCEPDAVMEECGPEGFDLCMNECKKAGR